MKIGDLVVIERLRYRIKHHSARGIHLVRDRRLALAEFKRRLKAKRYRSLVSANFILDAETGRAITDYELLEMGYSSQRISDIKDKLPIVSSEMGVTA